jgi:hypothetical protein
LQTPPASRSCQGSTCAAQDVVIIFGFGKRLQHFAQRRVQFLYALALCTTAFRHAVQFGPQPLVLGAEFDIGLGNVVNAMLLPLKFGAQFVAFIPQHRQVGASLRSLGQHLLSQSFIRGAEFVTLAF